MNPLAELRDIHFPDSISWWPLAPGWYIVIFFSALLFVYGSWRLYKLWSVKYARDIALAELKKLNASHDLPLYERVSQLSILLRRVALAYFPRRRVAGLSGKAWLEFLDQTGQTSLFTKGIGRDLIVAPYHPDQAVDWVILAKLAEQWIKRSG